MERQVVREAFRILCISKVTNIRTRSFMRMSKIFPWPSNYPLKADTVGRCSSNKLFQHARIIQGASLGTFYLLPTLNRSLEKLYRVIDSEMYSVGAQKITMPCLAPKHLWNATDRWDLMGSELLTLKDRHDNHHCLAPTHEEAVTSLVKSMAPISHKQLPIKLYQIGRKFRDEMRPKNGLLRCREFEMKDLYTFDLDVSGAEETYKDVTEAYRRIFDTLGLDIYHVHASSGAMGGSVSHEFHLISNSGEDTLYKCMNCSSVYNEELVAEKYKEVKFKCHEGENKGQPCSFEKVNGIEIAHSFILGTKYSDVFNAGCVNKEGRKVNFVMGCYGIGVTRLLAAAVEVLSKGNIIRWPKVIAPYQVVVIPQKEGYQSDITFSMAEKLCHVISNNIPNMKTEVILDDRLKMSIGERLSQANFLGVPHAVILGKKTLEAEPLFEFRDIYSDNVNYFNEQEVCDHLKMVKTVF